MAEKRKKSGGVKGVAASVKSGSSGPFRQGSGTAFRRVPYSGEMSPGAAEMYEQRSDRNDRLQAQMGYPWPSDDWSQRRSNDARWRSEGPAWPSFYGPNTNHMQYMQNRQFGEDMRDIEGDKGFQESIGHYPAWLRSVEPELPQMTISPMQASGLIRSMSYPGRNYPRIREALMNSNYPVMTDPEHRGR